MTKPDAQHFMKLSSEGVALISAVMFLCLTVLIYIPAEIYFSNRDSFVTGFGALAGVSLAACILAAGAAFIISKLLRPRPLRIVIAAFSMAAIVSFILGSVLTPLTIDLGLIDGGDGALSIHPAYYLLDIALLAGLFSFICFRFEQIRSFLVNLFVMGGVLIIFYAAFSIITSQPPNSEQDTTDSSFDPEQFFALSKQENVILILLDSFDSRFLDLLLLEDPNLETSLDGFTFFHDAASLSPTTTGAMPGIHSGKMIAFDRPLGESYDAYIKEGSFLTNAAANADVMLLNAQRDICPRKVSCGKTANLESSAQASLMHQWRVLTSISIFRSAPYMFKPALYKAPEWFVALTSSSGDADALGVISENLTVDASRPQVRFMHFLHTHTPYNRADDCTAIPPRNSSPSIAINTVRCAMTGVLTFLDALKQSGVYDQTKIIIFADHGAVAFDANIVSTLNVERIDVSADGLFRAPHLKNPASDAEAKKPPRSSHPLLLVKPRNAHGKLAHNDKNAASLVDIGATACAGSNICSVTVGYDAFEAPPASERTRHYYAYELREFQSTFGTDVPVSEVAKKINIERSLAPAKSDMDYDMVRHFNFNRDGAIPGFGFAERWGRWSAEENAHFELCFDARPKPETEIVIKARAYLAAPGQRQRVLATLNNRTVLDQTYSSNNPDDRDVLNWRFALLPGDINDAGCVNIDFEMPDASPPPDNWREAGRRRIGIGLISMQLENLSDAQQQ